MNRRWLGIRQEFWWAVHNLLAHPLSQLLYMAGWLVPGCQQLGDRLHDATVPEHEWGTGHG